MIAAFYGRKSTEDERRSEDGKSTERQRQLARAFAERQGGTVAAEYVDEGISGAEFANRPEFSRLLRDAKRRPRPFGAVIVMALNRLGRDQARATTAREPIAGSARIERVSGWARPTKRSSSGATTT